MNYLNIDIDLITITFEEKHLERFQMMLGEQKKEKHFYKGWIGRDANTSSQIGFLLMFDGEQIYANFHDLPFYYSGQWKLYHDRIVSHVSQHKNFRLWRGHASRFDPDNLPRLIVLLNELAGQVSSGISPDANETLILLSNVGSEFGSEVRQLLQSSAEPNIKIIKMTDAIDGIDAIDTIRTRKNDTCIHFVIMISKAEESWIKVDKALEQIYMILQYKREYSKYRLILAFEDLDTLSWLMRDDIVNLITHSRWRFLAISNSRYGVQFELTVLKSNNTNQTCLDILRIVGGGKTQRIYFKQSDNFTFLKSDFQANLSYLSRETKFNWSNPSLKTESPMLFTATYPDMCVRDRWTTLLAYFHNSNPDVIAQIKEHSFRELGDTIDIASVEKSIFLLKGTKVTVVPVVPGVQFNPRTSEHYFEEELHISRFRFRTIPGVDNGSEAKGVIAFYIGIHLIAEVPITLRLRTDKSPTSGIKSTPVIVNSKPFAKVFVSYSHRDNYVVDALEQAYNALGMPYLRDVKELRSGEVWNEKLLSLIDEAEVFQLCWSDAAKDSLEVRREFLRAWERKGEKPLIRPCTWQDPMPEPWKELSNLHFALMDLRPFVNFIDHWQ